MGKRTAERFVEEGATVILAGRREAEGQAAAREMGARAHFVRTDVAREDDVKRMIGFAVDRYGRLDCLFNNAVGPGTSTTSLTVAWVAPGYAATTTAHCQPW